MFPPCSVPLYRQNSTRNDTTTDKGVWRLTHLPTERRVRCPNGHKIVGRTWCQPFHSHVRHRQDTCVSGSGRLCHRKCACRHQSPCTHGGTRSTVRRHHRGARHVTSRCEAMRRGPNKGCRTTVDVRVLSLRSLMDVCVMSQGLQRTCQ